MVRLKVDKFVCKQCKKKIDREDLLFDALLEMWYCECGGLDFQIHQIEVEG